MSKTLEQVTTLEEYLSSLQARVHHAAELPPEELDSGQVLELEADLGHVAEEIAAVRSSQAVRGPSIVVEQGLTTLTYAVQVRDPRDILREVFAAEMEQFRRDAPEYAAALAAQQAVEASEADLAAATEEKQTAQREYDAVIAAVGDFRSQEKRLDKAEGVAARIEKRLAAQRQAHADKRQEALAAWGRAAQIALDRVHERSRAQVVANEPDGVTAWTNDRIVAHHEAFCVLQGLKLGGMQGARFAGLMPPLFPGG